ncbi:MAG: alkyl hydroperoxide reductase subunit F [Sorangiineae bacterium]|nr:alkyl hydroperoxide reductase subunit F [Polyangiaceae bacterium]MEB2323123.1 alkyl hydroperoxide reductase subunit F [Sorangiineae bacterium]
MLDDALKAQLEDTLTRIQHPLELTANLDDSDVARELRALLADLAEVSPHISVVEARDPALRAPSFSIHRPGESPRVRFAGVPLGHELTSLVLALLHVGGHAPRENDEVLAQARALAGPLAFETFFSIECQSCPTVVQALNLLAALNPDISHTAIDGAAFRDEVAERRIMSVPTVLLNGAPFSQGRLELEELIAKLDDTSEQKRAEALGALEPFDVLVVGGGPAGATAAVYAARKGIRTGLVADRLGGQVLDTNSIENYPGLLETDGPRFAASLEAHVRSYPVEVVKHERAARLLPGELIGVELESGATLRARSVILATGARWRDIGVPGEEKYRTRGVTYCPHCDGPLFAGKRVAVIGGGNSGVEAAIDLAGVVGEVTVIEFMDALKADAVLVRKLRSLANARVILGARTTEIVGDGQAVTAVRYEERASGAGRELPVEGVFVQIGLLPNTRWLEGVVELAKTGEIVADERGRTSLAGVFAAGDATTVPFKQIVAAAGGGAVAALSAFDHLIRTSAPAG